MLGDEEEDANDGRGPTILVAIGAIIMTITLGFILHWILVLIFK